MNRIGDYALIGDCHSAALVGRDGSIDWACFPRFDCPAAFCRILDARAGGFFAVAPERVRGSRWAYLDDTNVLVTEFECEGGVLEVTDCMPVAPLDPTEPTKVRSCHAILRRLRCTGGAVEVRVTIAPRFEYGLFTPRFVLTSARTAEIVGGADAMWVSASASLEGDGESIRGHWRLRAGEEVWVEAAWSPSHEMRDAAAAPGADELARRLASTIAFWRAWIGKCWYEGEHGTAVRRSARHFTHSKLNCWVALDRAARIAARLGQQESVARWARERDAVRDYLLEEAAHNGWFTQAVGVAVPDASTLLAPALGLLPTTHPVALKTIEVVRRDLERDGLVYRYLHPDGLEGGEGSFLLCSFWLLDCLTHAGRLDQADALLERLLVLGNDLGLYSEQVDPSGGEALGNFPQAFTHMALVLSCAHLSAAKRGQVPFEGAHDYAELALDRLLARGRRLADAS